MIARYQLQAKPRRQFPSLPSVLSRHLWQFRLEKIVGTSVHPSAAFPRAAAVNKRKLLLQYNSSLFIPPIICAAPQSQGGFPLYCVLPLPLPPPAKTAHPEPRHTSQIIARRTAAQPRTHPPPDRARPNGTDRKNKDGDGHGHGHGNSNGTTKYQGTTAVRPPPRPPLSRPLSEH